MNNEIAWKKRGRSEEELWVRAISRQETMKD